MKRIVTLSAVLFILAWSGDAAFAQGTVVAPPGNSGVDEYLEVVPSAGGDTPARGADGVSNSSGQAVVPRVVLGPAAAKELAALGADGRAAAGVAAAGTPPNLRGKVTPGRMSDGAALADPVPSNRLETIANALPGSDDDGMGVLFPLLLASALLIVGGVALGRRRTRA